MARHNKKFYRPGTLEQKGTKLSLKTQPYMNGMIFDVNDPITSFHQYVAATQYIIHQYEYLSEIPGMKEIISDRFGDGIYPEKIAKIKLLLEFLARSPIEVVLKEQIVDETILNDIAMGQIEQLPEGENNV